MGSLLALAHNFERSYRSPNSRRRPLAQSSKPCPFAIATSNFRLNLHSHFFFLFSIEHATISNSIYAGFSGPIFSE
ncbi:hypothetical protein Csa_010345 [Cucumis sativus]|uniref:Uncharacterized protein n=1 Tax=Cucumis sativus TaxID=3659 RepID=A0A0A0L5J7_CUCSA|nr:hypothetical protein Csa_010345 [Cucumis sativus]